MTEDSIVPRRARHLFALLLATSGLGAVQACNNRGQSDIVPLAGSVWGTDEPAAAAEDTPQLVAVDACTSDLNCNDVNSCTKDWCQSGKCVHPAEPSGVRCGSGVCNGNGSCTSGCLHNFDCPSKQVCSGGRCVSSPR